MTENKKGSQGSLKQAVKKEEKQTDKKVENINQEIQLLIYNILHHIK